MRTATRRILESIGIEPDVTDQSFLDGMLARSGGSFPPTREFSAFARKVAGEVDVRLDPDAALITWMEQEEVLFRTLERHLVTERLRQGFGEDVDAFVAYSLSVHNRRKSRAGHALEHHLAAVFRAFGLHVTRAAQTENNAKPDFLFPGTSAYQDTRFDEDLLTMLGAKATCKDRWRQVLAEAGRIPDKHLLTLEPAISSNQTDEMRASRLLLMVPRALHSTYSDRQRGWLLDLAGFCTLVTDRQRRAGLSSPPRQGSIF